MSRDDPVVDLLLKPENAGPASVVAEAFRSARRELEEKFWEDVAQALPRHVSDVDAKWTVERPESTSVDDAYDAFLMVLPKAASRHEPPPVYPAVQYFPPSAALFIGLSWREQRPHPATLEAPYSDMRTRVGVDLEQDGWWLAYEMRPYDLKSPDLCGELADERQRNLPARKADEVAEVLARRYVAAMGEHLRDIATSPPGGDRAE